MIMLKDLRTEGLFVCFHSRTCNNSFK
jgi:hypothetical protein